MSEIARLKKENKQLKVLLKTAVGLLKQSKDILQPAAKPKLKKKRRKAKP